MPLVPGYRGELITHGPRHRPRLIPDGPQRERSGLAACGPCGVVSVRFLGRFGAEAAKPADEVLPAGVEVSRAPPWPVPSSLADGSSDERRD